MISIAKKFEKKKLKPVFSPDCPILSEPGNERVEEKKFSSEFNEKTFFRQVPHNMPNPKTALLKE